MSELLWIAVPGGAVREDGAAPLAVVIVPRLAGGGGDLAGHGMDRWPDLLHETSLAVEFRRAGGAVETVPLQPAFRYAREEMVDNWRAMFMTPSPDREPLDRVEPPRRDDPAAGGIELLATTDEATEVQSLYAMEVAGQDWGTQLGRVALAGRGRATRAARRGGAAPGGARGRLAPAFHDVVAFLREHPQVLRAFGLIVDADVAVPGDVEGVRVVPTFPPWPAGPVPRASLPWTRCRLEGGRFLPEAQAGGPLSRGLVRLGGAGPVGSSSNPDWSVITFDVDAAMTRMPLADEPAPDLPGLRSAGLGLLYRAREGELRNRMGRASRGDSADGAELLADDLVLGYRVDVVDEASGEWRSLCERSAEYTVGGRPLGPPGGWVEEGHVKRDAMTAAGGPLEGDELLARWDGWSLAVPRPVPGEQRDERRPTPLEWRFAVVPRLERLRFGRDYRLRARVADIAGGGLTVSDLAAEGDSETTLPILYGRAEPIPAPLVSAPGPLGRGAGPELLIVRGPGGPPPEIPGIDPDLPEVELPAPVEAPPHVPEPDVRLLSPPPVSLELADQHGMFDEAADAEDAWGLAKRALPALRADADAAPLAGQPVPWLTDPLAPTWVVRPRGGIGVTGDWGPEGVPVELRLTGGPAPAVRMVGEAVSVALPPAHEMEVEVASIPHAGDIDQLAVHRWAPGAFAEAVRAQVLQGAQRHVTPWRTLRLVHAVQRPLKRPGGHLRASRAPGETSVTIAPVNPIDLDRMSTARLDLAATWSDRSDTGPGPALTADVGSDVVTPGAGPWPMAPKRHELGDTRRRQVRYRMHVVSRFQEYFDPALAQADAAAFSVEGGALVLDIPSSARPAAPVVLDAMPAFAREGPAPAPGWTEWRRTRRGGFLRVRMPAGWYSSGEDEQLAVVVAPEDFPPEGMWPFLSEAGRDPVMATWNPRHWLLASDLGGPTGPPVRAHLEELGAEVPIVPFRPWRDEADGGWIADVDLGPLGRTSYRPFVELALVRYQPLSLDRLHISPVVRTEMVQLLPDRELTVRRPGGVMTVVLAGVGPAEPRSRVEAWVERWTGPPDQAPTTGFALLDDPGAVPALQAWARVPGAAGQAPPGDEVQVPEPALTEPRRLVVREIEMLPQPGGHTAEPPGELERRVVFTEIAAL